MYNVFIIITNAYLNSKINAGIIKTDISDHFPVFLVSNTPDVDQYSESTNIYKRYNNENSIQNFKTLINNIDWNAVYQSKNPNESYI